MSKRKQNKKLSTEKKIELTIKAVLALPPVMLMILEYIKYFSK